MRKIMIAGNWKLNKKTAEAIALANGLKRQLYDVNEVDILICPVFTVLADVKEVVAETNVRLGAQDVYWEEEGAFTGEVSAPMLKDVGAEFVIIGHSERRQYFGETDETVNKKIKAALGAGLTPVVCVGENLEQREGNQTMEVIRGQCEQSLAGLSPDQMGRLIIAYEPVWAIGTGKTATADQAQEAHQFIRELLVKMADKETASGIRILYGGSVKPDNAAELVGRPDIDGALVGGASLKEDSFVRIVQNSCGMKKAVS